MQKKDFHVVILNELLRATLWVKNIFFYLYLFYLYHKNLLECIGQCQQNILYFTKTKGRLFF